jgi:hypothetical protein
MESRLIFNDSGLDTVPATNLDSDKKDLRYRSKVQIWEIADLVQVGGGVRSIKLWDIFQIT